MVVFTIVRLRMREAPQAETREPFEPMPAQSSQAELALDPRSPESGERAAA
jgi:hypothetical protein